MIDEHSDSKCRMFLCYREAGAETAKSFKYYLKKRSDANYGRVWYSDDEIIGNFKKDVPIVIPQCDYYFIFVTKDFTKGFLTDKGDNNVSGYVKDGVKYTECITLQEFLEIEKQRQSRNVSIITVNIDDADMDFNVLETVLKNAGILRKDSIEFYKNLNRNIYVKRQADFDAFAKRLARGLELKEMIGINPPLASEENNVYSNRIGGDIKIIDEHQYQDLFSALIKKGEYPIVDFFGYTGQVLSSDLLHYSDRYSINLTLRILQRNFVIEEKEERKHNDSIAGTGLRPWDKAASIKKMCYEEWPYSMKRIIKYYSHQPILKGTLFCTEQKRPVIGFVNFQKWEKTPLSGGSEFKSVPSDMIFIDARNNKANEVLLERLGSQFEYEWEHALSQEEMKNYKEETSGNTKKIEKPDVIITDFDRTLIYLYRDITLLTKLAKIISDFYSDYIEVDDSFYFKDGYYSWHELHQKADDELPEEQSADINKRAEELVTRFEREVVANLPLFDGIKETVNKLSNAGIRMSIVSSNSSDVIEEVLIKNSLDKNFEKVEGRDIPFNPLRVKPSPYQLNKCITGMNVKGKNIWYTGDDVVDMKAAKRANVVAVGIASGKYSEKALYDAGADICFKSFNDITEYLNIGHE